MDLNPSFHSSQTSEREDDEISLPLISLHRMVHFPMNVHRNGSLFMTSTRVWLRSNQGQFRSRIETKDASLLSSPIGDEDLLWPGARTDQALFVARIDDLHR